MNEARNNWTKLEETIQELFLGLLGFQYPQSYKHPKGNWES